MNEKMEDMEEVCPTEEVVQALLECMVEPLLGRNSFKSKEVPTLDQQRSMAKQVEAVVWLYNYYYRKRHQDHKIEFLNFTSFCQLAVVLKPSLITYMKLMRRPDYTDVDDLESQISLTERAIMRACDISSALDAAQADSLSEKWPTSKVLVFLVDSRRENCLLMRSSMTYAVWSIIEKHLDMSSGYLFDSKCMNKKKRSTNMPSTSSQYAHGAGLEELALSAAAEATGINRNDLVVLESHLAYSLDKEKATARLYLVQFTKSANEDFMVPIGDVIESLQGPLIKKVPSGWAVSPAVEYFHLLPYRDILSNWYSRELLPNGLQDLTVELVAGHAYDVHIGGSSNEKEVNEENVVQLMIKSCNTDCDDEKIVEAKRRGMQGLSAVGSSHLDSQHSEDVVTTLASKESAISRSALTVLFWKREKLSSQLRTLEDEIALCDKTIRTVLNGGENDLPLKIEALVDGCNDACVKGGVEYNTNQLVGDQSIYSKGKRLSEAILTLQNQCQQLDQLCCRSNWALPTYRVFPFESGFQAKVIVKGADFELTSESNIRESPREARESAAARMIAEVVRVRSESIARVRSESIALHG